MLTCTSSSNSCPSTKHATMPSGCCTQSSCTSVTQHPRAQNSEERLSNQWTLVPDLFCESEESPCVGYNPTMMPELIQRSCSTGDETRLEPLLFDFAKNDLGPAVEWLTPRFKPILELRLSPADTVRCDTVRRGRDARPAGSTQSRRPVWAMAPCRSGSLSTAYLFSASGSASIPCRVARSFHCFRA